MTSSTPRALCRIGALCALAACGGASPTGRAPRLVSARAEVDQGLAAAQQLALADARYDEAAARLGELRTRYAGEALAHVATLRLARIELARAVSTPGGDRARLTRAVQLAVAVPVGLDPALDMQRALVLGLLAARAGDVAQGLSLLRPLDGRMIDPGENVSVACGLLSLETGPGGDAGRALRSLARVEAGAEAAVRWLPTGLPCEDPAARRRALDTVLAQVQQPQLLADALDLLPTDYAGRTVIARRLLELARARREVSQWLRWLGDLGSQESTLLTDERSDRPEPFTVGLIAPITGERSSLGVGMVRAVQIALVGYDEIHVLVADEGEAETDLHRSFDTLHARGVRWMIGPTREEYGRALAQWARQAGVNLFLLAPWEDALPFGSVQLAAPGLRDRLAALRAALLGRGRRVSLVASETTVPQSFVARVRADLAAQRAVLGAEAVTEVHAVVGSVSSAERERTIRRAAAQPARWFSDARLEWAGMPGTWVGVAPGPAFDAVHARFCQLTGRPPGEFALLAHDAARMILQSMRGEVLNRATDWTLRAARADLPSPLGEARVAAMVPCRETVLPPATHTAE